MKAAFELKSSRVCEKRSKVDSEYLRFPVKAKVDYFIFHSILVYSFVI